MKFISFIVSFIITVAVIVLLSTGFGSIPPFGKFLSPQHGFWQNAEPVNANLDDDLNLPGLKQPADVYFDDRMVPHIFAANTEDAYYMQGYVHAKFRLWQMEFQVYAAAGRLTEILGPGPDSAYLNNDRKMRRMGMVFGAKRSLEEMEKDTLTRGHFAAYTAGVNACIAQLTSSTLPLEYRLLNYAPEKWTNLKTALLLKYLSLDLTGSETDIEFTNAKSFFSRADYEKMYPVINDSSDPIIPKGTIFPAPSVTPKVPGDADSLYFGRKDTLNVFTSSPDKDNGSNNWVAGGTKTQSGRPILCNDPHLGLNLPSLWYEVHISTPEFNVYGASLPGSPAVIIGFNDSIAWGVTNAARDVLDFYSIKFNGNNKSEYWYNGAWAKADIQVENFTMKDGSIFHDTVAYTVFGPVMYDDNYNGRGRIDAGQNLAIRWKAHEPSNEFKTLYLLNRATNYDQYVDAIKYFKCPGQNFAFASKSGDIAVWQQGEFPAKWERQGDYVMPGQDGTYNWQADIPQQENPHIKNPPRGFVSSANQIAADTSYPYYLNTDYDVYRGLIINRLLAGMNNITARDMQNLQNENYNAFAETALPFLLSNVKEEELSDPEKRLLNIVKTWNRKNDPEESGPTIFTTWIDSLNVLFWNDELLQIEGSTEMPSAITSIDLLKKDSSLHFIDDIRTPKKETIADLVTNAFKRSSSALVPVDQEARLPWSRFKDAGIRHLLRMEQLSRYHLTTGGGVHIINATKQFHGPSWKMVVHLTDETEAYGIYPGGQTGNPGNRAYDEFVDDWAQGKYYRLWLMKKNEANDRRVKARWAVKR